MHCPGRHLITRVTPPITKGHWTVLWQTTCGESIRGLVNSQSSELTNTEQLNIIKPYLYTKPNPIEYRQCSNNVLYWKSHMERLRNQNLQSNSSSSWPVRELICWKIVQLHTQIGLHAFKWGKLSLWGATDLGLLWIKLLHYFQPFILALL